MNVQELTDVELNRAMIWLYCKRHTYIYRDEIDLITLGLHKSDGYMTSYLKDWNLTMPLAAKNCLCVDMEGGFWANNGEQFLGQNEVCDITGKIVSYSDNPLRAICEVLVMIKLGEKQ